MYLFYCGSINCKHSPPAVYEGRKFHLKYVPAGSLGGSDPPAATGVGAWMLLRNPALRKLGQNVSIPKSGKDPFKRPKIDIHQNLLCGKVVDHLTGIKPIISKPIKPYKEAMKLKGKKNTFS